jgi:hypothetical protein
MTHPEIASNYTNWIEFFDTDAAMPEVEFDATPMDKRIAMLADAFGAESPSISCFDDEDE